MSHFKILRFLEPYCSLTAPLTVFPRDFIFVQSHTVAATLASNSRNRNGCSFPWFSHGFPPFITLPIRASKGHLQDPGPAPPWHGLPTPKAQPHHGPQAWPGCGSGPWTPRCSRASARAPAWCPSTCAWAAASSPRAPNWAPGTAGTQRHGGGP